MTVLVPAAPSGPTKPTAGWGVAYANGFALTLGNAAGQDNTFFPNTDTSKNVEEAQQGHNPNEIQVFKRECVRTTSEGLALDMKYQASAGTSYGTVKNYAGGEVNTSHKETFIPAGYQLFNWKPCTGQRFCFEIVSKWPANDVRCLDAAFWSTDSPWTDEIDFYEQWGWPNNEGDECGGGQMAVGIPVWKYHTTGESESVESGWGKNPLGFDPSKAFHRYTWDISPTDNSISFYIDGTHRWTLPPKESSAINQPWMGLIIQNGGRIETSKFTAASGVRTHTIRSVAVYIDASKPTTGVRATGIAPGTEIEGAVEPGGASATLIQEKGYSPPSVAEYSTSGMSNFTVGNMVAIHFAGSRGAKVTSISGGGVAEWKKAVGVTNPEKTEDGAEIWYGFVTSSGVNVITVQFNIATSAFDPLIVSEWSGIAALDKTSTNTGKSATMSTTKVAPSSAGDLFLCIGRVWSESSTAGPSGGWHEMSAAGHSGNRSAYIVAAASGEEATSWALTSDYWAMAMATFSTGATKTTVELTSGLSFQGSVARKTKNVLSAALSFTGSIARPIKKALKAALSFVGSLGSTETWEGYSAANPIPATRQIGSTTSAFNRPIANTRILPNSAEMVAWLLSDVSGFTTIHPQKNEGFPTVYAANTDPQVEILDAGSGFYNKKKIRIPNAAKAQANGDKHLQVVLCPNDCVALSVPEGTTADFWQCGGSAWITEKVGETEPNKKSEAVHIVAGQLKVSSSGKGNMTGSLLGGNAIAAQYDMNAGEIRAPEARAGIINHALQCLVWTAKSTHIYPATSSDGSSGVAAAAAMGQRFFLEFTEAEIKALKLPLAKEAMLRALATYGFYIADTGNPTLSLRFETSNMYTAFGVADPWKEIGEAQGLSQEAGTGFYAFPIGEAAFKWSERLRAVARPAAEGSATPTITNPGSQESEQGHFASLTITGSGVTEWEALNLPAGLSINSATGVISGTPTTISTKTVTIIGKGASTEVEESFVWAIVASGAGTKTVKELTGGLSFVGAARRMTIQVFEEASLSFVGKLPRKPAKALHAVLSLFGKLSGATFVLIGETTPGAASFAPVTGQGWASSAVANATGALSILSFYVPHTTNKLATETCIGIWADDGANKPGAFLGEAVFHGEPVQEQWNEAQLEAVVSLTKGVKYWLSVMVVSGVGSFADHGAGGSAMMVDATPRTRTRESVWSPVSFNGPISIYGKGGLVNTAYVLELIAGLGFVGAVNRGTRRTLSAGASFTGAIARKTQHSLRAALSYTGSVRRKTGRVLRGALSFVGSGLPTAGVIAGCGANAWGNLGTGFESADLPYFVEGSALDGVGTIKKVRTTGGGGQSLALTTDGQLWGIGSNGLGTLCDGTWVNKLRPVRTLLTEVEDFELGGGAGIAKMKNGAIMTWGSNSRGQIGDGLTNEGSEADKHAIYRNKPYEVFPPSAGVVAIAAQATNAGVIFSNGRVAIWGANNSGQIGDGTEIEKTVPTIAWEPALEGEYAVELVIGAAPANATHIVIRRKDGRLMAWGRKYNGQCGIEPFNTTNLVVPTLVPAVAGTENVIKITAATEITFTVNANNELYVFGMGNHWCHGLGYLIPEPERATQIAALGMETVVNNEWSTVITPPRKVRSGVRTIGCEQSCTGIVTTSGELLTCGKNGHTQLGRGKTVDEFTPVKGASGVPSLAVVPGLTGVVDVSVSIYSILCQCESCSAQPFYALVGKKRAVKARWTSSTGARWNAVLKKLGIPSGEEFETEAEEEEGAQFNRRHKIFLGATTANGLNTSPLGKTFTEAAGKGVSSLETPALSPAILDSVAGHRSQALLDLSSPEAAELQAELAAGAIFRAIQFKWYGTPELTKPKLGLTWTNPTSGVTEATAFIWPEEKVVRWYGKSVTNVQKAQITWAVLGATQVFAETGTGAWSADAVYVRFELEWPNEFNRLTESAREYETSEYKGEGLEPGDLYSLRIGEGPEGWLAPTASVVIQGVRKLPNRINQQGETATFKVEAFGANATGAYSATGLPPGASINKDTGLVTYTLSAVGTYTPSIKVSGTDEEGVAWTDTVPTWTWAVSPPESIEMQGELSFSGTSSRATSRFLKAGASFAAFLLETLIPKGIKVQLLNGSVSFTGRATRLTSVPLRAGVSFVGAITRSSQRALSAGLSLAGVVQRAATRSYAGAIGFVGVMNKNPARALSSVVSFTGGFKRASSRAIAAGLSFIGDVIRSKIHLMQAEISFAGAIARSSARSLVQSSVSFTGGVVRGLGRTLNGELALQGVLGRFSTRSLVSGALSFTGAIGHIGTKVFSSGLSFVGSIGSGPKQFIKIFTATLALEGSVRRRITHSFTSILSLFGSEGHGKREKITLVIEDDSNNSEEKESSFSRIFRRK